MDLNGTECYFHKEAINKLSNCLLFVSDSEKEFLNKIINKHKQELKKYNSTFDLKDYSDKEYSQNSTVFNRICQDLMMDILDSLDTRGVICSELEDKPYEYLTDYDKLILELSYWTFDNEKSLYKIPHSIISANITRNRSENSNTLIGRTILECLKTELKLDFNSKKEGIKQILTNKLKQYEASK